MSWNDGSDPGLNKDELLVDPFADPFEEDGDDGFGQSDFGGSFGSFSADDGEGIDIDREMTGSALRGSSGMSSDGDSDGVRRGSLDLNALLGGSNSTIDNAMRGAKLGSSARDRAFLKFKRRSVYERAMYNTGCSYLAGLGLGGMFGFFEGLRNVKGTRLRIRINSVLNGCSRRGARTANSLGVLAMMFSLSEGALDHFEAEKVFDYFHLPRNDMFVPIAAAGVAGMIYRAPAAMARGPLGIPIMFASGVFGMAAIAGVAAVGPRLFGDKSPFTFA